MGVRLRRLREEKGLTQAALARTLELSPSYLNQLEQNQRPMTVAVLLKINAVFGEDIQRFAEDDSAHLIAELREISTDLPTGAGQGASGEIALAEIKELVANMPGVARALVNLHNQRRQLMEQLEALAQQMDGERLGDGPAARGPTDVAGKGPAVASLLQAQPQAYEEVRNFFFVNNNHFARLDDAAEAFARQWRLPAGAGAEAALVQHLQQRHGVHTVYHSELAGARTPSATQALEVVRRFEPASRTLTIQASLTPGQRAFQLATQFALLEMDGPIRQLVHGAQLASAQAPSLARIGLANYVAGALLLPYTAFLQEAQQCRYDIEWLSRQYGVGFETICHRLSTLQRPHHRGIPFFFIRVDRAGNISKRQSATHFHFSKIGGTCPLWNVYEAFAQPGRVMVQVARMPDGRTYLWVARTVSSEGPGWGRPGKTFSVALGCDIRHAEELVYSKGLNLHDPEAAVPIGMGCKVCEREACMQRAFPPIGKPLRVDENQSQLEPYLVQL
ncbi:hypothetical protein EV687_2796 [Corticibacter populi]|nr:hypothetical protein EV687_2796 [Corticibacter populi]